MERKTLWEKILDQGTPWATDVGLIKLLCDELEPRLKALERPEGPGAPTPDWKPRPELAEGDVVRLAGQAVCYMLRFPQNLGASWVSFRLGDREIQSTAVTASHIVEVYRAGKLLWRLPEPEGGYRDE